MKRRKVWVVAWEEKTYGVLHCGDSLYDAKYRVPGFRKDHPSTKITLARFVESRSGDKILGREQIKDLIKLTNVDPGDAPAMRLALAAGWMARELRGNTTLSIEGALAIKESAKNLIKALEDHP